MPALLGVGCVPRRIRLKAHSFWILSLVGLRVIKNEFVENLAREISTPARNDSSFLQEETKN